MITPVTMLIFRVRFGTVNKNQSQECEYIVKFPLIRFNAFSSFIDFVSDHFYD